jgi:hypothetical protein
MTVIKRLAYGLFGCLVTSSSAMADIFIGSDQNMVVLQSAREPARGVSMHRVEAHFGKPRRKQPAVGSPPISRWDYDKYTVYFEGDRVLHTVVHSEVTPGKEKEGREQRKVHAP